MSLGLFGHAYTIHMASAAEIGAAPPFLILLGFAVLFALVLFCLVGFVRASFSHKYLELGASAARHRATSKSRNDSLADGALESLVGVGIDLAHARLIAIFFRVLFVLGAVLFVGFSALLCAQMLGYFK